MNSVLTNKAVELINDSFTPNEVNDLIIKSIDNQINSYKLKNLSNWIHDHNCNQTPFTEKIEHLQKKKEELQNVIQQAQSEGCNLKLQEKLEIKLDN